MTSGELPGLSYGRGSSLCLAVVDSQWFLVKSVFGFQIGLS